MADPIVPPRAESPEVTDLTQEPREVIDLSQDPSDQDDQSFVTETPPGSRVLAAETPERRAGPVHPPNPALRQPVQILTLKARGDPDLIARFVRYGHALARTGRLQVDVITCVNYE